MKITAYNKQTSKVCASLIYSQKIFTSYRKRKQFSENIIKWNDLENLLQVCNSAKFVVRLNLYDGEH